MGVLDGKKAVVSGGSRGIGRAIVERLARDGADVVFAFAGNTQAAATVERSVAEQGQGSGSAHGLQADFGDAAAVEKFLEQAVARLGALDILVNNAASSIQPAPLAETTDEVFGRVMAVNSTATFQTLRYAARHMRDGGRVINISSLNTLLPGPEIAPYVASKGAMEQLTRVAAIELGPRGITVNTVSPGATDTDLLRSANPAEALEQIPALTPLGRLGEPADIADVVGMLVGPDARWITGQNILATGGLLG